MIAPRIRSKNQRARSSSLSGRKKSRCYVCIFALGLIIHLLYASVAIYYLTNDNHNIILPRDLVHEQLLNAGVSEQRLRQMNSKLPKWDDIVQQYGTTPITYNLDSCATYQRLVPAQNRVLGAAGMFNTGTNLVT